MYDLDPAIFERRATRPRLRLPSEGPRRRLAELGIAFECLGRVVRDTGDHPAIFELLHAFPLGDLLRVNHRILPITRRPAFRALFEARSLPALDADGAARLSALPLDSLGGAYAAWAAELHLDDAYLDYCPLPSDPGSYLAYRLVLLHDLVHFLTGYRPGAPLEEAQVEAFLLAQTGAFNHVLFLSGFTLNFLKAHPRLLLRLPGALLGAFARGLRAQNLLLVRWQDQLGRPLEVVRQELGLVRAAGEALRSDP